MELPSYIDVSIPSFDGNGIRVKFRESSEFGDAYMVRFGDSACLRMRPADLRDLITTANAAMIARGDLVDYAALAGEAVAALESLAHELRWHTNGRANADTQIRATLDRLGYLAAVVAS